MINCNGSLVEHYSEIPPSFTEQLHTRFSISELLRFHDNSILFLEQHYFRLISSLRRHRFAIPMEYTMDFLATQITSLVKASLQAPESVVIRFQFFPLDDSIAFIISLNAQDRMHFHSVQKPYTSDLFKEVGIAAHSLSNLSSTNQTLFTIARSYAKENGLDDCVLLNNDKNLVETLEGSLYCFQGDKILTPSLASGCQDFAIRTAFNDWTKKYKSAEYQLLEQNLNPFELQKSEEVMVLSITRGGQAVTSYRKTNFQSIRSQVLFESFLSYMG